MLELDNVTFPLGDDEFCFNMQVPEGSCVAVIGPSGAGKSTLLSLIAGFEQPSSGAIRFAGKDLTNTPAVNRPVSSVFQAHNLFEHLSVADNIGLGIHPNLKLSDSDKDKVSIALQQVGLDGYAQRMPPQLSGGERQRVALARALVRQRPYLLLDEPFAALGPALRQEMLQLVNQLRQSENLTVVLVSHHPEDAKHGADYAAFIHSGRVLALETTAELFARQDIAELQAYLGNSHYN